MKRRTKSLAVIGVAAILATLSACSDGDLAPDGENADAIPPPADAATDAVPNPSSDNPADLSASADPNAALPAPPADPNALPAPTDPNAAPVADLTPPPPAMPDVSAPPAPTDAPMPAMPDVGAAPAPAPVVADATPPPASSPSVSGGGGSDSYTIQQGDTLMKIAFETYGDLYQWKKIYEGNKDKIRDPNNLSAGVTLSLEKPAQEVTIERNGEKYMIKKGDTLGSISEDLYGTKTKWKKIWKNNKQLIKDPNKIYAGFLLYYTMTPEERDNADKLRHETAPAPMADAATGSDSRAPASVPTSVSPPAMPSDASAPQAMAPPPAMPQQNIAPMPGTK
jgi:nucleoid-associated protein YgaU